MKLLTISTKDAKYARDYNLKVAADRKKAERKLGKDEFLGEGTWMKAKVLDSRVTFEAQQRGTEFTRGIVADVDGFFDEKGHTKSEWEEPVSGEKYNLEWI